MNKKYLLLTLFFIASCAKTTSTVTCPTSNTASLLYGAKSSAERALNAKTNADQMAEARKGMQWGEGCVQSSPQEPGCYFYRAVNTGLYYEAAPLNYQKGLKKIIRDCNRVIELDPAYDGGGAFRILGNIYLKVPSFALSKKAIRKDMDLAVHYASQALAIDPKNHDNLLLWAEILMDQERFEEAEPVLKELRDNFHKTKSLSTADQKNKKTVDKWLSKAQKKLTKGSR